MRCRERQTGGGAMANVVVGHSFNEEWIAGQLEVLRAMRLNGKRSEDPMRLRDDALTPDITYCRAS